MSNFDDFAFFWNYGWSKLRCFVAVFLGNQKLKSFKEILNQLLKAEKIQLFNAVCDFPLDKDASFNKRRNKDLQSNKLYIVEKKCFVLFLEGPSSVWKEHDLKMLEISVFTLGFNLQFFNRHEFVTTSDRCQLSESSFQRFDPIKNRSVKSLKIFLPAVTLHFVQEPSSNSEEDFSWIFNLNLLQTLRC